MDVQSLLYALTQIAHNFGAVAVVGGSLLGRWPLYLDTAQRRPLAWLVLCGWVIQGLSGAGFGAISIAYYGEFPDIHGIAVVALMVKLLCATSGFVLAFAWLFRSKKWTGQQRMLVWNVLIILGVTALTAAAFLRWFS